MTMSDHHRSGQSVDDAVAFLTASFGDDHAFSTAGRLRLLSEMVEAPDAGARIGAAIESLAAIAAGIIEAYADELGEDPAETVAAFALLDHARRGR